MEYIISYVDYDTSVDEDDVDREIKEVKVEADTFRVDGNLLIFEKINKNVGEGSKRVPVYAIPCARIRDVKNPDNFSLE